MTTTAAFDPMSTMARWFGRAAEGTWAVFYSHGEQMGRAYASRAEAAATLVDCPPGAFVAPAVYGSMAHPEVRA